MRRGAALFWAALLGFALVDLALMALPRLAAALNPERAAKLLAYLILGAAALSLGWLAGTAGHAIRERRPPAAPEALRAVLLLALLAGHALLILRARG